MPFKKKERKSNQTSHTHTHTDLETHKSEPTEKKNIFFLIFFFCLRNLLFRCSESFRKKTDIRPAFALFQENNELIFDVCLFLYFALFLSSLLAGCWHWYVTYTVIFKQISIIFSQSNSSFLWLDLPPFIPFS